MRNLRVLKLRGEIDISRRQSIEEQFEKIGRSRVPTFTVLDVTGVGYLDTTFLNALIRARNRIAKEQPENRICVVAPRVNMVWRLFGITKLDSVFALFDTMASARRSVASSTLILPLALPA